MPLSNHRWNLLRAILMAFVCGWTASSGRADIYEWTTGTDGSIVQSSTVCPGGSGVNAVPNARLYYLDLTQAYLLDANLTNASLQYTDLTNANATGANLTGAKFLLRGSYQRQPDQ